MELNHLSIASVGGDMVVQTGCSLLIHAGHQPDIKRPSGENAAQDKIDHFWCT